MNLIEFILIVFMGMSAPVVFDYIIYIIKSAPKTSNYSEFSWNISFMIMSGGIGYFILN